VVAGGLALAACGPTPTTPVDAGVEGPVQDDAGTPGLDAGAMERTCPTGTPSATAFRIELREFPALQRPGGTAVIERPDELLNLWVLHLANGCFAAVWRVCTHGACDVTPRAGPELYCPCHGSRFGLDGAVLQGPATRPLRTFLVRREGDTLFLERG
jgi:nitrite reductase/ring-hydroxylating ferredoxin subunit